MNIVLIIALVVGFAVCMVPAAMAWSYYFGGHEKVEKKRAVPEKMKPAARHIQ